MRVLALCSVEYRKWVKRSAGVEPLLSPPLTLENVVPSTFENYDLLYFKLFGQPDDSHWYNTQGEAVVSAELIRAADLSDATVFVANCYLPESPMLEALRDAGAKAVIGGAGFNYFRKSRLEGVDLLGLYVRVLMQYGASAQGALKFAKARLMFNRKDKMTIDTLAFKVWGGKRDEMSRVWKRDSGQESQ